MVPGWAARSGDGADVVGGRCTGVGLPEGATAESRGVAFSDAGGAMGC